MRFVIVLLISLAVAPCCLALSYQIFAENGKVGIKNESGEVVLPAAFEALGWSDGSFSVIGQVTGYRSKNQWGLLNLKKELLTKAEYEQLIYSGGDRVIVSKKINPFTSRLGCINLAGKQTIPFRYDGIKINGLRAMVFVKNGSRFEHGLIDLDDKGILPLKYKSIESLGSLRYSVQNFDNKIALYSEEGVKLTDFVIDSLSAFHKGSAIIYQNFKQGLLNRDGEITVEPIYREIKINDDGSMMGRTPDAWKVIDTQNKELEVIEADALIADGDQYRIRKSGKTGTLNKQFKTRIPAQYDYLGNFIFGKAAAKKANQFGVIRKDNAVVLPFQFDSLVVEGRLIRVKDKTAGATRWLLFDTLGVQKTERPYDFIDRYNGSIFPVLSRGYFGGLDIFGKEIIHCVYDSILQAKDQRVVVKFKGMYGIISLDEKWILTPQPRPLTLVNNDLYLEKQEQVVFLKNFNGQTVYFTSHPIAVQENFLVETMNDGTVQKMDFEGRLITPPTAAPKVDVEKVFTESEGMRGIKRDGKYGFVDTQGKLRVANRYEGIGQFKEGLAPVKILGKWGYVNKQDRIIVNPSYEEAGDFINGAAIIKRNGKTGLTDLTGKIILPLRYDQVERHHDKFIITLNELKGLADGKGDLLIEPRFHRLEVLDNNQVIVGQGNKYGVISTQGMSIVPILYDALFYVNENGNYLALMKSEWKKIN